MIQELGEESEGGGEKKPRTWSCRHCGRPGGHKRKKCPNAVFPEKNGGRCGYCCDMAHRREIPVCRGCKEPYEPETVVHPLPSPGSGLGNA
jgi:hypothetical protein